jgi:ubiquinone/menaquinone biosynthesis C-methylase UbiE
MKTQTIEKRLWATALGSAMTWRMLQPVVRLGGPFDVDADVLHIGCGTGRFTETLAKTHPQWRITALDSDTDMLSAAHRRLYRYGPRIRIVRADPPALPYPDASFDLVIAAHVWHRLPRWRAVTLEAARVLRPQGLLAITDSPVLHVNGRHSEGPAATPVKVAVTAAGLTLADTTSIPGLGYRIFAYRHKA